MAIIPRANPEEISRIGALPRARNEVQVRTVDGMADAVGGLAGVATDLFQKQQAREDNARLMQARDALSQWETNAFDPENAQGVLSFKGLNALGANEKLLPDLDKTIGSISARMSPRQREQFDEIAQPFKASFAQRLNTHMQREHEAGLQQVRKATIDNTFNQSLSSALDGDMDTAKIRLSEAVAMQERADLDDGQGAEVAKFNRQRLVSSFHAQMLDGTAGRDSLAGRDYLNTYGHEMLPADRLEAERKLAPLVDDARAQDVFDNALLGGPQVDSRAFDAPGDGRRPGAVPAGLKRTIEAAADRYGVPRNIALGMAEQESAFNPQAVGPETKWGRARGLFQYLDSTASNLGIDPLNPEQSANAAMRTLAEQAKARGFDWAIAHHHAGPNEKEHGPKTRAYVESVRQRARRWGGGQGEGASLPAAASEAEVFERLAREPDPVIRAKAEEKARDFYRVKQLRKEEALRAGSQQIHAAIENAPIGQAVRDSLTPQQYAMASENGWLTTLETRRKQRIEGTLVQDDPRLVQQLQTMMLDNPGGFAKLDLGAYATRLAPDTRARFTSAQADVLKPEKMAQFATEAQLLNLALGDMGMSGEASAAKRNAFEKAYFTEKRAFIERNNREPSADESQKIINQLKLPFSKPSFLGFGGGTRRAFEGPEPGYRVPAAARAQIVAALREQGNPNPSEEDIRATYARGAGDAL